jgi:phage terminase large subunit GpA-like protein
MQGLSWKQIRFENNDPSTTKYICVSCEKEIEERFKTQMLERGEWVKENPDPRSENVAGFHLSSLYSPLGWYSWSDAVDDFLKAKGKPDQLRTFVNTVLGEVWAEKGDAPDWRRLYERREPYKTNVLPLKAAVLTGGIDVQKDRLEVQLVAWAQGKESWSIDYRVFPGDTSDLSASGPWAHVTKLLQETWQREDGSQFGLRLVAIDSGYNTQVVYDFVRRYPSNRVIATKGQDSMQMLIGSPSAVDVFSNGKRVRRGLKVWSVGASMAKSELYGLLRLDKPTEQELAEHGYPPGFVHFPEYGEDYFRQLTAEQLTKKLIKGFTKFEWEKVYERNEALDTWILCRVAAAVVGIDRFTPEQWGEMQGISTPIETKAALNAQQTVAKPGETVSRVGGRAIPRRKSIFW